MGLSITNASNKGKKKSNNAKIEHWDIINHAIKAVFCLIFAYIIHYGG